MDKALSRKDISDLQVCRAYAEWVSDRKDFADEVLQHMSGLPHKICWTAMCRAEARGLIEYGVSLRSGWLTEKGLNLLKEAEDKP